MPPFLFIFFLSSSTSSFCVVVGVAVGTAGLGVVPAVFDGNASFYDAVSVVVGC